MASQSLRSPVFQAGHASSILVTRSTTSALLRATLIVLGAWPAVAFNVLRATYGPLLPRFALDPGMQGIRDFVVTFACCVLVDERRTHAAVTRPVHQFPRARTAGRRQVVSGMPQVVEVEASRQAGLYDQLGPPDRAMEIVPAQWGTQGPTKDQLLTQGGIVGQVLAHDLDQRGRNCDRADTGR